MDRLGGKCLVCGMYLVTKEENDHHHEEMHRNEISVGMECPYCGYANHTLSEMKAHMDDHPQARVENKKRF